MIGILCCGVDESRQPVPLASPCEDGNAEILLKPKSADQPGAPLSSDISGEGSVGRIIGDSQLGHVTSAGQRRPETADPGRISMTSLSLTQRPSLRVHPRMVRLRWPRRRPAPLPSLHRRCRWRPSLPVFAAGGADEPVGALRTRQVTEETLTLARGSVAGGAINERPRTLMTLQIGHEYLLV